MSEERDQKQWRQHVPTRDGMHISLWRAAERRGRIRARTVHAKAVRQIKRNRPKDLPLREHMRLLARKGDFEAKTWCENKRIGQ